MPRKIGRLYHFIKEILLYCPKPIGPGGVFKTSGCLPVKCPEVFPPRGRINIFYDYPTWLFGDFF